MLWNEFRDREVPDIELPPEDEEEIRIPELHETELGNEAKQLAATALAASENLSPDELRSMAEHYIRLCNERNVEVGQQQVV